MILGFKCFNKGRKDRWVLVAGTPVREGTIRKRHHLLTYKKMCLHFSFWRDMGQISNYACNKANYSTTVRAHKKSFWLRINVRDRECCIFYIITPTQLECKTNRSTIMDQKWKIAKTISFAYSFYLKKVRGCWEHSQFTFFVVGRISLVFIIKHNLISQ